MHRTYALLTWLLLGTGTVAGQGHPAPPPPASGPAPLLHVRLSGPAGSRVTVYQGGPSGVPLASPATLALRPGYVYRVKVSELPGRPGVALYPSLEVRGTLHLPPGLPAAHYPAAVVLRDTDIDQVLAGAFLTKVVALEHPERAAPVATVADQPLETEVRAHEDILAYARVLGRPVLIVRLGGRTTEPDDMASTAVLDTVLLPGGKALGQPPVPPHLPWDCHALYDPILGPRPPEEECLHDGGDAGRAAGIDTQGRLRGLDPADTVAEYSDSRGSRRLAVSNRVCVCVPRFAVLRMQIAPSGYDAATALGAAASWNTSSQVRVRTPSLETGQHEHVVMTRGRERPGTTRQTTGPVLLDQFWGTAAIAGRREGQEIVGLLMREAPEGIDRPLLLHKWADRQSALVGEVVTFYLKYTNVGGKPIDHVVLSDSLTGRLEFIPGSARADRSATFTTQANEAGSVILRWEMGGKLLPGQSGMVSFQAIVR